MARSVPGDGVPGPRRRGNEGPRSRFALPARPKSQGRERNLGRARDVGSVLELLVARWTDDEHILGILLLVVVVGRGGVPSPVNESRLAAAVGRCRGQTDPSAADRVCEGLLLRLPTQAAATGRITLWADLVLGDQVPLAGI